MSVLLIMATKRQSHCGRPSCRVARAVHHILARACEHFVEPGSKEAHELRRAHLVLVSTPVPIANGVGIDPVTGEVADGPYDSEATDEEETVEIDPPTDAQLLSEWRSGRGAL